MPGSLVGDVSVAPERPPVPLTPPPPRHRNRTVVRLRGELAFAKTPRMRRKLLRALARAPGVLEVDLARATYLSPDAGALLLATAAAASRRGTRLAVTHADRHSLHILRELGMQRLMDAPLIPDP
ncbi:STAS domain-containing protein [Streptomyces sp. NPDC006285]|uniref:STAS domain-containing protein n=1 Tax=Streptomyces sp. NPDC006285 TaxID=3364742 RepID=UPI0036B9ED3F